MSDTPNTRPTSALGRFRLAVLVPLARLRFLVILGAIGLAITQWGTLVAYYEKWTRPDGQDHAAGNVEFFCPMHPTVVRDNNKEKCPICFMPLSKRTKGEATGEALPAGTVARVQLSPYRVVLAGVRTAPVEFHPLAREITTVGTVEFDERAMRNVSARFKGRIEELFVNQTGQAVKKGDPLAALYSPDLVTTVQNLLDARAQMNADLERLNRTRLGLWGIEPDQIDEILRSGKPITRLTVRSPIDGHVIKKYAREGQYVDEGGPLYDVADLNTVWVQARLYEEDLAFLPRGAHDPKTGRPARPLPVEATARGLTGQTFRGALSFIFPHVDSESRTLTVRFEMDNPDYELRPGLSATVRLRVAGQDLPQLAGGRGVQVEDGKVLAIPEGSVIDTGRHQVVYRESLPNTFDGVLVELGPRLNGPEGQPYFPVLKGLEPGDVVVTAGSFLIDAETRLNPAAGSIYIGGSGSNTAGSVKTGTPIRPTTPDDEEGKVTAALGKLSPEDRALAKAQKFCPVLEGSRLGSMGVPIKLVLDGQPVFVCCQGCVKEAQTDLAGTLRRVAELKGKAPAPPSPAAPAKVAREQEKIRQALARLTPEDRGLAEKQKTCPVTGEPLGSMGVPAKVMVKGEPVFVCCAGCDEEVLRNPDQTLKQIEEYKGGKK